MKHISFGPCVALIGAMLISIPQGFAQNTATSEPLRFTVAPNAPSQIEMKTLPKATCVLHAEGDTAAEHSFKTFADDEGSIRFQVRPSAESEQAVRFAVDCTSAGKSSTFALDLRPSSVPTADMPAPQAETRTPQPGDVIRPALTKSDATRLSGEELAKRGYPIRPDAKQAPEAFATWLTAVTKPSRLVDARQVSRPEVRHVKPVQASNFETSGNWSGFELRGSSGAYDLVEGEWYVPRVYYENNSHTYSAYWIGLDGDGTSDLWQAGTEQEIQDIIILGIHFDFTNYYAWTEFLPPQATEQVLPNFTVTPGDLMFTEVWVGNAGSSPSLSGLYAIAFVEDISRGEYTTIYNCRGFSIFGACTNIAQTNIGGSEAEWIMERPTVGGSLPDLADYSYSYMYAAYAEKPTGSWITYNGANNQQIFMYNGNDLLSGVYPSGSSTMLFYWFNSH
jgi:Peptidase A4 family